MLQLLAVAHSSAFLYVPEPFSNCGLAHIEEGYEEPAMTGLPKALPWSVTISCKCRSEELHPIIVQCHGNLIETEPGTGRSDVILTTASCLQRHTSCRQCKVIQQAPKRAIPISIVLPNLEYQTNHLSNNVALLFTATYIKFNNASSPVCLNDDKDEGKAKERCVVTSTGNGLGAYPAYIKAVANYSEHRCNTSTTAACTEISLQPPSDYIREGLTMLCQRNNRWVLHAIGDGQWSNNRTMLANVADSKHWINTKIKYIRSNLPEIRTPRKLATRIRTSSHRNSTRVQVKDNCC
uniref:Peptidase S1 domain-containing protein n=1 Tax=Trichuris muris TaxID=70415 RepID=A0A5S6Q7H9_TRIMR